MHSWRIGQKVDQVEPRDDTHSCGAAVAAEQSEVSEPIGDSPLPEESFSPASET